MAADTNKINESNEYEVLMYEYAKTLQQKIRDLNNNTSSNNVSFGKYDPDQIYTWLKSPYRSEKNLRNASIYFWNTSTHYRRLIMYHANLLTWSYILSPYKFDETKVGRTEKFLKDYKTVSHYAEKMNIPHEFKKAVTIALRDGIFFGAIWENDNNWYLQRINPDYCQISSVEDGSWCYSVDMSQIKEDELTNYPEIFTTLFKAYNATGNKWQEVPSENSICIKADETIPGYSIPPFISTVPLLYTIESYKELQMMKDEIDNYKLLAFELPTRPQDNTPSIDKELRDVYLNEINAGLPDYIGSVAVPFKVNSVSFERSGVSQGIDEVTRAEEQYWSASGVSSLLFGSAKNTSSSAMKLGIKTDEEIMFALLSQCERAINRKLMRLGTKFLFKVVLLPVTIFNIEEYTKMYKEAATYGLPVKSIYSATMGLTPSTISGMTYLENDILKLKENFIPLSSTHTQSNESEGRPTAEDEGRELSDEGENTREKGSNDNL